MTSIVGLECSLFQFLHLYSCKIDKENQDLLEIKSLSVVEREKLLTQEGDKEAKQGGDSRTNPKPLYSTSKLTPTKKNIPVYITKVFPNHSLSINRFIVYSMALTHSVNGRTQTLICLLFQ